MKGGCTCGDIRYEMNASPLITHACHCTWCQRETGGAFAINAVVETTNMALLSGAPIEVRTPSLSGKGQIILRCPACHVAVWSHYPTAGKKAAFVRVGTLDLPHSIKPDVHIFTASKRPWVILPADALAVPEFYNPGEVWSPSARDRWAALMAS
jgi:hypothetical protein